MMKELALVFEPLLHNFKNVCGCYAVNPDLLQQRPNQRILVPLRSSEYYVEIANSIANVTLTQTYLNPTDKFLEVEYSFPINPDACVYRFVAEFAKTRIEGVVKEKEQAKQEYQQAIKEGKKAAYGQLNADSKDIFNLKVGNVPPKETVRIEIVYLQELTLACNTFYQLHMVGTISPRYMNYIPAEQIKAGLRSEGAKVKGDFYWNFTISLRTSRKVIFFDSNSHDIELISQNNSCTQSELMMTNSCIPNKDFYFTYTTEQYQLPSYVFGRTDSSSTAMLSFIPKFCSLSLDDAYKASVMGKSYKTDISNVKGEYIFLLDRSGSMGGSRIEKAKEALILFIKSLPQDTYFNVISFGSSYQKMFGSSVKYNDKEITSAVNQIKAMKANFGGTDIYYALLELLIAKTIEDYPKQIFLLTDGDVANTQKVINMVGANCKYSRVHTIGVGNGCSEALVIGCAKKGKGHHVFISDQQNPSEKIIQLLTDSLSPVISSMKLTYDKEIVESIIPNPQSMPYVLKGELVNFYITFKGQLVNSAHFSFSYEDSLNKLPFQAEVTIDPSSINKPFIDRMGHFRRIRLLQESQSSNTNVQERMLYAKVQNKKAEIVKESVKHQILSVHTAFLCVQKELIDGKYEQVKDKGQLKVQIQNPQPKQPPSIIYQDSILGGIAGSAKSAQILHQCYDSRNYIRLQADQVRRYKSAGCCGGGGSYNPPPKPRIQNIQKKPWVPQRAGKQDNYQKKFLPLKKQELQNISIKTEPKHEMQQESSIQLTSSIISELISCQSADGSWKEIELIEKIFNKDIQKIIAQESNLISVITYLITKWIEKHYPESQYSLIVQKGLNFVKKQVQNIQKFSDLYDQYLK